MKRSISGPKMKEARSRALIATKPNEVYRVIDIVNMIPEALVDQKARKDHYRSLHAWLSQVEKLGTRENKPVWLGETIQENIEDGDRYHVMIIDGLTPEKVGLKMSTGTQIPTHQPKTNKANELQDASPPPGAMPDTTRPQPVPEHVPEAANPPREQTDAPNQSAPSEAMDNLQQLKESLSQEKQALEDIKKSVNDEVQQLLQARALILRQRVASGQAPSPGEQEETCILLDACTRLMALANQPNPEPSSEAGKTAA